MRGLSLIDILVILIVVAVLVFAGSREFPRYGARVTPPSLKTAPDRSN